MQTDLHPPIELDGIGQPFCDQRNTAQDIRLVKRARDDGWETTQDMRHDLVREMHCIVVTAKSKRLKIAAAKVLVSADMVNVNRERMTQTDELGPAHNTYNVYAGCQVVTAQVFMGMAQEERERVLTSGAQLAPDAIAALSADELQRLTSAARRALPQTPQQ